MTLHRRYALAGLVAALLLLVGVEAHASTIYLDGVSPTLSGSFDLGTHLPSYIGGTTGDCFVACGNGTALDASRVYFFDTATNPTGDPFNLLVWQFNAARDSVRLYPHQDHLTEYTGDLLTAELMEFSVWGCNGDTTDGSTTNDCKTKAEWTLLSDPNGFSYVAGKPVYTFGGASPAATIFRGGSSEFGLVNAYTQDFTFASGYSFFGIRSSTLAFNANTADPEIDALASFNRVDVPQDPTATVPEPGTLVLLGSGLAVVLGRARMKHRQG